MDEGTYIITPKAEDAPTTTDGSFGIIVQGQGGNRMHFKIRPTTRMGKMFEMFCKRSGVAVSSVRFLLDGERISADVPASDISGLVDGAIIDAVLTQTGGGVPACE